LILQEEEQLQLIFRILSGTAQVPPAKDKVSVEMVGAEVLRLFTYVSGEFSKKISTLFLHSGEAVVTTKRMFFIQDIGFLASKPVVVFIIPTEFIIAITTGIPYFPFTKKTLLITYSKDNEFYTIDIETDVDPEKLKKFLVARMEAYKSLKR